MVGIVAVAFVAVGSMMAGRLGWLRQSVDGLQATKGLISIAERWCDCVFFFKAEDGIRDHCVTGVQTCALPIFVSKNITGNIFSNSSSTRINIYISGGGGNQVPGYVAGSNNVFETILTYTAGRQIEVSIGKG